VGAVLGLVIVTHGAARFRAFVSDQPRSAGPS
jgi:hypothetical protein